MKKIRILSTLLLLLLLLPTVSLPVSATNRFSYSYVDSPFMTSEMKYYIETDKLATPQNDVLVVFFYPYHYEWEEGYKWEEIAEFANASSCYDRFLAVNEPMGVQFYLFGGYHYPHYAAKGKSIEPRSFIGERLFSVKEGYRYDGETYDIETIYWFDGLSYQFGGYAAIVTEAGTFFEYYNRPFGDDEQIVLTFTQEEFEKWYPEFIRASVEGSSGGIGGSGGIGEFDAFLLANGFTPRYGEAQGVTRRVLTYGGMTLAVVGVAGGITYAAVRHKRKKKAALPEAEEIA